MKKIPAEIQENLQFLCVEIDAQLEMLIDYFSAPSQTKARQIRNRSGYAYNLKNRVHSGTINRLARGIKRDEDKFLLRCIEFIATDVEKIADISRQILLQSEQLGKNDLINARTFISMLNKVRQALKLVMPAFSSRKSEHAIDIEKINQQFRRQHKRLMKKMTATIKENQESSHSLQALFVAYEMRQYDAAMLRISETLISANLGQPLNFERFQSLQSLFGIEENMAVTPIAETRSGSSISGLSNGSEKSDFMAVYKDGQKQKLKEERQGLESWHHIYPGLAPKILSYQKQGDSAALLIEHLPGYTFEKIIVRESAELQQEALKQLKKTLSRCGLKQKRIRLSQLILFNSCKNAWTMSTKFTQSSTVVTVRLVH